MSVINKKIQALKDSAQNKSKSTLLKATTVFHVMKEKGLPINFESVAKPAGVSKTWLYKQTELSEQINEARNKKGKIQRVVDLQSTVEKKNEEIIKLKEKNRKMKHDIKKLRNQLEVVYGELYKLKQ